MRKMITSLLLAAAALAAPISAQAAVRITEFMYQGAAGNGGGREFFELTNISDTAIDITGWYYDDDSRTPTVAIGDFFGLLGANESVIVTEMSAEDFRSYWGLDASVRVFGNNGTNLGNGDEINIYSSSNPADLVDRVTFPNGTTRGVSRNRPVDVTGAVANAQFTYSAVGDAFGSAYSPGNPADLGNPGRFPVTTTAVPEPASWAMMIGGFALIGAAARRKRSIAFA